jgi:hypothetical protein
VCDLLFHGRSPFDLFDSLDTNGKSIRGAKLGRVKSGIRALK